MAAGVTAGTPVIVERGRDEPQWQGVPSGSWPLRFLTQQKEFGAGGQVKQKLWRYDHDSDVRAWVWRPNNSTIRLPSTNPFKKLWRYDTDSDVRIWLGEPVGYTVRLPSANPFHQQWRYDYAPDPIWQRAPQGNTTAPTTGPAQAPFYVPRGDYATFWQGKPQPSNIETFPAAAKPFSKLWRWDQVPDPVWTWPPQSSDALFMLTAAGKPFSKQWRWDHVPDPVWMGTPVSTNIETFPAAFTEPFSKLWRYDYQSDPVWYASPQATNIASFPAAGTSIINPPVIVAHGSNETWWQGAPVGTNVRTFPATSNPFSRLWRYDYVPDQLWLGTPQPTEITTLPPTPTLLGVSLIDTGVQPDTFWIGKPTGTNIETFPAGTKPFSNEWGTLYNFVPGPVWQGTPQPSSISTLPATNPFHKLWRWDNVPDPVWQAKPQPTNVRTFPVAGQPFSKLWRYDYAVEAVWLGSPTAAPVTLPAAAATGPTQAPFYVPRSDPLAPWQGTPQPTNIRTFPVTATPFSRLWRWDFTPDPVWLGEPQPVNIRTLTPAAAPFSKQWRWDNVPEPVWVWQPPPSDPLRFLTVGGAPAHRLWRYDYDSGATIWQGVPLATNISTLPQTAPFSKLWRYDWDSGQSWWQGAPQPTAISTFPAPGVSLTAPVICLYNRDSAQTWWQGTPIGVNVPIANPGPPVPPRPPSTGAGGERRPSYSWKWSDFNDRAWLRAFREEFERLKRLKNPERRREQFEVLEQKFIGAVERSLEYETPYEKKLDLVQLGEALQDFAAPASFDRIEMYLVALAAEIDDEEAFLLLNN